MLLVAEDDVAGAQEFRIVEIERGGHEAIGVDQARSADQDTVFIDEIDLAVRAERAVDFAHVAAGYPVEDGGIAGQLIEGGGLPRANGEAVPIHDRAQRIVLDDDVV